ncbi:MAG: helix-turn-helix transcriptional regulator [Actinophytocola sp.]|uniref:helix-turn-helix domain-containing protein n=1 Tax=Actinophytocola sp. TaxID=1872138 RepID=UPI003C75A216
MSEDPTILRRRLGRLLRQARNSAKYIQEDVAKELGCRQAKINKIERSLVDIDDADLDKLIVIYGIPDDTASELRLLAARYRDIRPKRPRFPPTWMAYGDLGNDELEAREIRCWHSERIPVPLQSEQYRLALCDASTQTEVTDVLSALRARTQIFRGDDGPYYRAVLSESSLRRMPNGSPDLVVDVAQHLLGLIAEHPNRLELRILTFGAPIRYVDTDFVILQFPEGDVTDYTYVEDPGGARTIRKEKEITPFRAHWTELHDAALGRADTEIFLSKLAHGNDRAND